MVNLLAYGITVIIIYFFSYFGARILSKKAISEMTAYEVIGVVIMATVAAEPLVTKITSQALFGTGLLILLTISVSKLSLVNKLTYIFEHTASILVKDGKLQLNTLRRSGLTLNMFYGLLRQKGYSKIGDLEYAVMEPQGKLSTFPKSQKRPVQPSDLKISTSYEGLSYPLVIDGKIVKELLDYISLTESWLMDQLKQQGIKDIKEVAVAEIDNKGNLHIMKDNKD